MTEAWAVFFQVLLMVGIFGVLLSLLNGFFKSIEYNAFKGSSVDIYQRGQNSGYERAREEFQWVLNQEIERLGKEVLPEMAGKFKDAARLVKREPSSIDFYTGKASAHSEIYQLTPVGICLEIRPREKDLVGILTHDAYTFNVRELSR